MVREITVLFLAVSSGIGAFAGTLTGTVFTNGGGSVSWVVSNPPPGQPSVLTNVCNNPSSACVGSTQVINAPSLSMQYNAGGAATMGMLHVYSDSKITGTPGGSPPAYAIVGGTATFEDTLILQGGTTGSAANLGLSFTLDGMANFTNANGGDLFFYLFAQPTDYSSTYSAQTCHFVPSTGNVVVTSVVTCPNLAVTFGQSFFLTVSLSATTNVRSFAAGSTANLDYANTAALSGITVTDSLGNAVAFSINSASGATYTANGVVPEPSSGPVVAISLFCLGSLVLARRNVRR